LERAKLFQLWSPAAGNFKAFDILVQLGHNHAATIHPHSALVGT